MTYRELLEKKTFAVAGDTLNPDKYAYRIKKALIDRGYTVYAVGKEAKSLDDIPSFDVLDLCINPVKGLELIQSAHNAIPYVLIQPGAGSDEIRSYLTSHSIPFDDGCVLKALGE